MNKYQRQFYNGQIYTGTFFNSEFDHLLATKLMIGIDMLSRSQKVHVWLNYYLIACHQGSYVLCPGILAPWILRMAV